MISSLPLGGLVAFAAALLLLWILSPVARHIGLVDRPRGRKSHARPTPLVGGIALFVAFAFALLACDVPLSPYRPLFAGALILVVVGVLDDFHELSSRPRFLAQIFAGLLMTSGAGVVLEDFGNLLDPDWVLSLGILAVPATLFATLGVINAVNMSDGLDGLAAALALVALGALGLLAWTAGAREVTAILWFLAASLLAFLIFNLRIRGAALVFMGDAGSMFLGFVLAWLLIQLSQGEDRLLAPVTALWVMALPLMDTVSVMLRRIGASRSPFAADREHLHHLLLAAGFSPKRTLALILGLALLAAAAGVGGHFLGVPEHWMFFGFLALFFLHYRTVSHSWRAMRFLNRPLVHPTGAGR